jgi:dihydroflavonol-4-reductase
VNIAITGSSGFIGARLVRACLAKGAAVRAVRHRKPGGSAPSEPVGPGLEYVDVDLRDPAELAAVFRPYDVVVHAAAVLSPQDRRLQEQVNIEGTRNVIDACRQIGVARLVHVSTTAAVGISADPGAPADEQFAFNLEHLQRSYNNSKYRAERLALDANDSNLETMVVNPGFVFGEHGPRYRGAEVMARTLGPSFVVCTGGGLSIVHVDDVVEGIIAAAQRGRPGERYILAGDNLTFRAIADTVRRVAGVRKTIVSIPDLVRDAAGVLSRAVARIGGGVPNQVLDRRYAYQFYSSDKARRELGYQPRPFEDIVGDFLRWVSKRHLR